VIELERQRRAGFDVAQRGATCKDLYPTA
jgi:hypothetical protein